MARKPEIGLKYFNHECTYRDNLNFIVAKYKSEGYHIYFEILRKAYQHTGYYMAAEEYNLYLLSQETTVKIERLKEIIIDCVEIELFNKNLYKKFSILTAESIQSRYLLILHNAKRTTAFLTKQYILLDQKELKKYSLKYIIKDLENNELNM